ncbi:plasmid stabilization protein [Methyloversatilis sp. RAC08]|nr:plasmid stabilization protein [Methyloversatilis sp. RAC08]
MLRELIISVRRSGFVTLFEIEDQSTIAVIAARRWLEGDNH